MLLSSNFWVLALLPQLGVAVAQQQQPLLPVPSTENRKQLYGRFLHITDLHPDPFYKQHSSVGGACHRGSGRAGLYGAEVSSCDSPFSLINATLDWINKFARDVDFVVWTGDSARHDNDEDHPRSEKQVADLNRYCVEKVNEVFGSRNGRAAVPVVPSFGNNDMLPHNIFTAAPNRWTRKFLDIWEDFIPESQTHTFETGGWYYVEVIPNRLAVFSLNTMYFFNSNSAVDGCFKKSEPGFQQFRWLRIQLEFMRKRGMKAILSGHVPPGRTSNKQMWDETCWQVYTVWLWKYRDVVVGSFYGHMNADHFVLQDREEIDLIAENVAPQHADRDNEMTLFGKGDYLNDLRLQWSHLPKPPKGRTNQVELKIGDDSADIKNFEDKIGGPWGERFSLSLVCPSVIASYFPTVRIMYYNVSAIDTLPHVTSPSLDRDSDDIIEKYNSSSLQGDYQIGGDLVDGLKKTKRKKGKHSKKPRFKVPKGPSKSAPPGPAYSPQTLTLLGYQQFYANITEINNDLTEQQHRRPHSASKPDPKPFEYKLEYDTRNDGVYGLEDLTVRNYIELAARIGQYKPPKQDILDFEDHQDQLGASSAISRFWTAKKGKKGKHHGNRKIVNKVWFTFVRRAFVGTKDDDELHKEHGQPQDDLV